MADKKKRFQRSVSITTTWRPMGILVFAEQTVGDRKQKQKQKEVELIRCVEGRGSTVSVDI